MRGSSGRVRNRAPVLIAASLVVVGCLALACPALAFSPFGVQRLLVIPLAHEHPGPPSCPTAASTYGPICPPYTPSDLQTMLQNGLDAWYPTETLNQTSWQVRVLGDPHTGDGWWPAPHTLAQYGASGNNNFTSSVAQVRDAGETVLSQAIRQGVIGPFDALSYHRFLVIDNWNHNGGRGDRAGQTNSVGVPLVYHPTIFNLGFASVTGQFVNTASVVSVEVTSPTQTGVDDFLSVVRHELGHQLGEPDLYSQSPCPNLAPGAPAETHSGDSSDCVGPWDHMALDYSSYPGFGLYTRLALGWVDPDPLGSAVRYIDKSFSGTITLDPLEQPQGAPVGIAIPADLGTVALARLFGVTGPYKGFLVECRKHLGDDTGLPGEGVLVSYIDPTRGNDHPEDVARGSSSETATTAILSSSPLASYSNSTYGFTVRYAGATADGGCRVAVNVPWSTRYAHLVPAVSWLAGMSGQVSGFGQRSSHAVFAGEGVLVNGPGRGPAGDEATGGRAIGGRATGGRATGGRVIRITPLTRGGRARIRFSYANVGSVRSRAGIATVSVTEPYTISACGPEPVGRAVARVHLPALGPGQVATAQVAFRARTAGPIGVTVQFPATGPKPFQQGGLERAVLGFQTHMRGRGGRFTPLRSTILVTSSRHCSGPVTLTANALVLPKGWSVDVSGLGRLAPGQRRRVSIVIGPPKGSKPQALDIPVALSATVPAPALLSPLRPTPAYFAGGEPELLGGLDLLTRVGLPGRPLPPFVLPPPAPPAPFRRYPPRAPARQPSTLALTCPASGPFGVPARATGRLSPPDPGSVISITYTPNQGQPSTHTVAIDPTGGFSDSITPQATRYTVQASWAGDARLLPAGAACAFSAG